MIRKDDRQGVCFVCCCCKLYDAVIQNISTLPWARLLSIDPNARGTRCHESQNRVSGARERVQKPTPRATCYKYRTRTERGLIGPVAVFLVRSFSSTFSTTITDHYRWSMNRSRDLRLPFWLRVKRRSIDGGTWTTRGTFERKSDRENDKVAGESGIWANGSSILSVEYSGLGSMLIVMPIGVTWNHIPLSSTRMKNSKSMMDIEDICGCSKLPSIIPKKELPHLKSTSGKFEIIRVQNGL